MIDYNEQDNLIVIQLEKEKLNDGIDWVSSIIHLRKFAFEKDGKVIWVDGCEPIRLYFELRPSKVKLLK